MSHNLGSWDRGIRMVIGVGLITLGLFRGIWSVDFIILGLLGLAVLTSAVVGVDPLYTIYRISTRGGLRRLPCDEHGQGCRPEFHQPR